MFTACEIHPNTHCRGVPDIVIRCGGKTYFCLRQSSISPAHNIVSISTELSRLFKTGDRSCSVLGYRAPPGADDLVLVHMYNTTVCHSSGALPNDSLICSDTFVTITPPPPTPTSRVASLYTLHRQFFVEKSQKRKEEADKFQEFLPHRRSLLHLVSSLLYHRNYYKLWNVLL